MVTFAKDLPFAEYSLRSIAKFCSGFGEVVIVVPSQDVDLFEPIASMYGFTVKGFDERPGKGFCHHMAIICEADKWCSNADAILHVDADCIFWEHCTPADFFQDEKPILYRERFEDFKHCEARYGWKKCVRDATGIDPEYECMVRHPSVHLHRTYEITRDIIGYHTNRNWREYILSCKNSFPQSFAEFPTLGAIALRFFANDYHFIDWSCQPSNNYVYERGRDKLIACWSHAGLDAETDRHPGKTARQLIEEILK